MYLRVKHSSSEAYSDTAKHTASATGLLDFGVQMLNPFLISPLLGLFA